MIPRVDFKGVFPRVLRKVHSASTQKGVQCRAIQAIWAVTVTAHFFRARIPAHLRQHFGGKAELKRSLRTDSRREAIKRARLCGTEFDRVVSKLEEGDYAASKYRTKSSTPR